MHLVYTLMRLYPFWALPTALICGQLGVHFRRKTNDLQYSFWGLVAFFVLTAVIWVVFRGDLNSDKWVRTVFG